MLSIITKSRFNSGKMTLFSSSSVLSPNTPLFLFSNSSLQILMACNTFSLNAFMRAPPAIFYYNRWIRNIVFYFINCTTSADREALRSSIYRASGGWPGIIHRVSGDKPVEPASILRQQNHYTIPSGMPTRMSGVRVIFEKNRGICYIVFAGCARRKAASAERQMRAPMLRIGFVCLVSLPFLLYYLWKAGYIERHGEKYSEADRYRIARRMVSIMKHNGLIRTRVYGTEKLPPQGGYVMYANHQGKYDSLGIIWAHPTPCTVMIDAERSRLPLTNEFVRLLKGSRLDKSSMKTQMKTILEVIEQVKSGRRYIIFPEGGYFHNRNAVQDFLPGAFKCAIKSRSPIVPVALIESYRPFGVNSIRPVTTQVHFLEPLYYDDYKEMTSVEIAALVRDKIRGTIDRVCGGNQAPAPKH